MNKLKKIKTNTQDLKDLVEFINENKKWYWYLPIVGYFISTVKINEFTKGKGMVITGENVHSKHHYNDHYSYLLNLEVLDQPTRYSDGIRIMLSRIMSIHIYTLYISFFLQLIIEIFVFNYAPILTKALCKKTIKLNTSII